MTSIGETHINQRLQPEQERLEHFNRAGRRAALLLGLGGTAMAVGTTIAAYGGNTFTSITLVASGGAGMLTGVIRGSYMDMKARPVAAKVEQIQSELATVQDELIMQPELPFKAD